MNRYFILLIANHILLEGAVVEYQGLKRLERLLGRKLEPEEFEQTYDFNANSYEYIPAHEIGADPRCGERNVFHDHNGNEWHN